MAVSAKATPVLIKAWRQALDHAGLDDDDFYLLTCPGAGDPTRALAGYYEPGRARGQDDLLKGDVLREANEARHRNRHLVAVFEGDDHDDPEQAAILSAKLQHEIEHARQYVECGDALSTLEQYAEKVLEWKLGGLPGGGVFHNLRPSEQDANAASAMLLRGALRASDRRCDPPLRASAFS